MAYRINKKPIKPEDKLRRFTVRNGATIDVLFPCYYYQPVEGHDPHYHDFIGWPSPSTPGDACQMYPPRDRYRWNRHPLMRNGEDLTPIHLRLEGYDEAVVTFSDQDIAEFVAATAWIDEDDDYLIRFHVNANLATFSDKPLDTWFTIFIKRNDGNMEYKDVVCHGILTVLPGSPYDI